MSSTEIQLVIEGEAVRGGTVDAHVLATALQSYSEAYQRANEVMNGRNSQAAVRVQADFRGGSFKVGLQLFQDMLSNGQLLLDSAKTAVEIAIALGLIKHKDSLLSLLKFLKGEKPDKITPKGKSRIEVTIGSKKKEVSHTTINLLGDSAIRTALASGADIFSQPGIDRLIFKHKDTEPSVIEKDEAKYFQTEPIELTPYSLPDEGERDAVLMISKLSFKEGTKWSFLESGAHIIAEIQDGTFFEKIHDRKVKFADGDRLQVRLRWKHIKKGQRLGAENVITKVYKILPRPRQLKLGEGTQNEHD